MGARMTFDMTDFNRQVAQVRDMIQRNGGSYVRTTARRLIRRLAWAAPHAPKRFRESGRLRAGFWPAATALGITNVYTKQTNKGEGSASNATQSGNPTFTIINSVPYVMTLQQGTQWIEDAENEVRKQMARDLTKYAEDSWARRDLIEDLTGN
jgi:hypothetical protein